MYQPATATTAASETITPLATPYTIQVSGHRAQTVTYPAAFILRH